MIAIAAPRLEIERVVLPIGGVPVACTGGELLAATIEGERWSDFHGRAASLALRELAIPAGRVTVGVHELRAAGFELQLADRRWEIAARQLDAVDLRVEIRAGTGKPDAGGSPSLGFLDEIDGELEVAVTVKLQVPVVGSVAPTRRFRVRIRDGALDHRALQHELPWVEDALLDFALRGDRLVLEHRLPARAGGDRELVAWPLDGDGVALARVGRVRLRTLPFFTRRPREAKRAAGAGQGVVVRGVDVELARAELRFAAAPSLALGGRVRLRVGDGATAVVARGAVRHRPEGPRLVVELQLSAKAAPEPRGAIP